MCDTTAQLNAAHLDAAYPTHRTAQLTIHTTTPNKLIPLTVDGKTQHGTAHRHAPAQHQLGTTSPATARPSLNSIPAGSKTNEITAFQPPLNQLSDLTNTVIGANMTRI
ncbi:hypothetical protein GCM10009555_068880 [Acrocarpospora macrocephala]|uniref:Uncharacterized protein n=1 Tax=Acrocarpospora macrocephala TaxID=150177 RepID=A0A5M3X5V8_9ACTN|nr:hypothetical protein [Acrocarpospora macrocephala]GES16036.1 hypothetical protein Amac_096340 [Acrocarpospora macrocephala]